MLEANWTATLEAKQTKTNKQKMARNSFSVA